MLHLGDQDALFRSLYLSLRVLHLEDQDALLDGLAADGTLNHPVPAHLTRTMTAEEDHILKSIQTHRAHSLKFKNKFKNITKGIATTVSHIIINVKKQSAYAATKSNSVPENESEEL